MDVTPTISDVQKLQGEVVVIAAAVTMILALVGRWIGGVWTTLLATAVCVLLAFHPLINTKLFSDFKTDRLQMILIGLIPFTLILIGLSFKKIPIWFLIGFALIGPMLLLGWAFHNYDLKTPRMILFLHRILPISGAIFVLWLMLEPIAIRSTGPAVPSVIAVLAIPCTFLLMISPELNAGLMLNPLIGVAVGAALAAILSTFIRNTALTFTRGPVLLWLTILGLMFADLWISDDKLPMEYLYWLAGIPVLAWVAEIPFIHRLKPWNRELIRMLLICYPAVMAIVLAFKDHQAEF